jgi:hypothetical protein
MGDQTDRKVKAVLRRLDLRWQSHKHSVAKSGCQVFNDSPNLSEREYKDETRTEP